jgi:hypothetical protein
MELYKVSDRQRKLIAHNVCDYTQLSRGENWVERGATKRGRLMPVK